MILETCLTILSAVERGLKIYDWFSGARFGEGADVALAARRRDDPGLIKVAEGIFVDQSLREVFSARSTGVLVDIPTMRDLMEPVARAVGGNVLSSQIVRTPPRLQAAFEQDPWSVLDDVRPACRAILTPRPDWAPVAFHDNGIQYIGWQKRGALPQLFDCDFVAAATFPGVSLDSPPTSEPNKPHFAPKPLAKIVFETIGSRPRAKPFYVTKTIPVIKLNNAVAAAAVPVDEVVIAVLDTTVFGSAKNCIVFGATAIYYANPWGCSPRHGQLSYKNLLSSNPTLDAPTSTIELGFGQRCCAQAYAKELYSLLFELKHALTVQTV